MLTESQAWAKIAEAYERKIAGDKVWENSLAGCGFCNAVEQLEAELQIEEDVLDAMDTTITLVLWDAPSGTYLWPYTRKGAEHRAILAQLLSEATA